MHRRRRGEDRWTHTAWTYRRRALLHYTQSAALTLPVLVGLFTLSIAAALLLFLASELLLVLALPSFAGFRSQVDASIDRTLRLRAAAARTDLLMRMSDEHRRELEQLEDLAARLRAASALAEADGDEWLGLDNLLAIFVRLAITHRETAIAFPASTEMQLFFSIAALEKQKDDLGASEEAAAWTARRLAIAYDRRETWRRAREQTAVLVEEMRAIAELVRWMYEQAALGRTADAQVQVADAVAGCARSGSTLRELAALDSQGPVDGEVLRLGRDGVRRAPDTAPLPRGDVATAAE